MTASSRVAIVTGASRGIGRSIAKRLAAEQIAVIVNYVRDQGAAHRVVSEIQANGGTAEALRADISVAEEAQALIRQTVERFGRLDILINNAGVGLLASFPETTPEIYDRLFALTKGCFFAMQAAAAVMEDAGRIVNISSMATRANPSPGPAYAGSKAAIEQFTRALAYELGGRRITVNAVLPGMIETDMLANAPRELIVAVEQRTALRRLGRPDEVADLVAYLISEHARYISGELITVSGGFL